MIDFEGSMPSLTLSETHTLGVGTPCDPLGSPCDPLGCQGDPWDLEDIVPSEVGQILYFGTLISNYLKPSLKNNNK